MRPQVLAIFSLSIICIQSVYPGNPKEIIHYSSENGLSNNSVNSIIQDNKKFIWIGTNDGLNKFDSHTFTIYRNIPGDSTSLPSNDVNKIFLDSRGKLWIGTLHGGVCTYEPEKDAFKRFKTGIINVGDNVSDLMVKGFAEDKKGDIWIGTHRGLNRFNRKSGKIDQLYSEIPKDILSSFIITNTNRFPKDFDKLVATLPSKGKRLDKNVLIETCVTKYGMETAVSIIDYLTFNLYNKLSNNLLDNRISALYADNDGFIWIGYLTYGFSRFDPKSLTFKHYPFIKSIGNKVTSTSDVTSFYKYKTKLYIGYEWGTIDVLEISTGILKRLADDSDIDHLRQITQYDEKHLWIASTANLMILDIQSETLIKFSQYCKIQEALIPKLTSCLFTDSQKNRWIGTYRTGFFLTYNQKGFNVLNTSNFLSADWVGAIAEDKDKNFWIGYFTTTLDRISSDFKHRKNYSYRKDCHGCFAGESVFSILQDSDDDIWVGNYRSGLQHYNPKTDNFSILRHDPKNPNSLASDDIRAIEEDSHGNLWIAAHGGGLCKFDKKHKKFTTYKANYKQWENSLPSDWLLDLHIDNSGIIWISTINGFCAFDSTKKTFRSFRTTNSLLPHNYITDIYVDNHQNIWIGTQGGLAILERQTQKLHVLTTNNGLPNNDIKAILQDKKGRFWITTGLGMFSSNAYSFNRFNIGLFCATIINYDVSDGIASNEFYDRACCITKDGRILFGSRNGITMFYQDSIQDNKEAPVIYITDFKLFNNSIQLNKKYNNKILLKKPIYLTDTITLNYKENFFDVNFVALNFIQANKNEYKCILEGFDHNLQNLKNRHEVTYSNIPPGIYKLKILASNNDDVWSSNGKCLTIIIKPPIWKTVWFRIGIIGILGILLFALNYLRISQVQRLNLLLKSQVKKRTKEIEEKNQELTVQTQKMIAANSLLEERQRLIQDQSEKLRVQRDELKQLNATKDKLFAILAHDLKGPFNSIIGFSELILYNFEKYSKEKIISQLSIVRDSARTTYELMENLLNWSRAQRGTIEFIPEKINIRIFISKIIGVLKPLAIRKDLTFGELIVIGKEIPVLADPNMLSVIIRNLISNAIKYSNTGGEINIQIKFKDQELQFSITDHGTGIPDELKEKIINPDNFITIPGTSGEKGTGLGILLCSDFVARHNGKLWLESTIGIGTTFYFTIPFDSNQD